jgi:hypothetical protein
MPDNQAFFWRNPCAPKEAGRRKSDAHDAVAHVVAATQAQPVFMTIIPMGVVLLKSSP